jgi:uncharacterized protein
MNSCLYECHVMHARFSPRRHRFLYRIFLFALDLDELETLHRRLPLFSLNRPNLYSFREPDYLPTGEKIHNAESSVGSSANPQSAIRNLKSRVLAYLATRGVDLTGGRVMLVTLPRVFGYLFNPVSVYFCYDLHGAPVAALAEVTNTFKEMKPYFLGPDSLDGEAAPAPSSDLPSPIPGETTFRLRTPKHFYVSPFSDVDVAFDFTLRPPGDRLSVQIDDYIGPERTLTTTLAGPRRALTNARLAWFTLKYPLLTLRIIGLIHWHALLLWLKRVPWFAKSARAAEQRALFRPHASIARTPDAA